MVLNESAAAVLGPDGPLARALAGFTVRPRQQEMAEAVARTLDDDGVLVCEAGTGTGKTLAYLAPALAHGGKVVISTGTRTLQDQLFHRDLPLVRTRWRARRASQC
jgi:ATP-dependent DNA helicase DinG